MIELNVVEQTLDNAWCALAHQYVDSPSESSRIAMNLLAKIIGKVKSELTEIQLQEEKERCAVELQEFIDFFKEYA